MDVATGVSQSCLEDCVADAYAADCEAQMQETVSAPGRQAEFVGVVSSCCASCGGVYTMSPVYDTEYCGLRLPLEE